MEVASDRAKQKRELSEIAGIGRYFAIANRA
jgi:hypothetical protein